MRARLVLLVLLLAAASCERESRRYQELPAAASRAESTQVSGLASSFTLIYDTGNGNQNYTINLIAGSSCPMLAGFLPSGTGTTLTIQLPGGTL